MYITKTVKKIIYPPIISDIVLGLEDIVMFKYGGISIRTNKEYYAYASTNINKKILEVKGVTCDNRKEALLQLCIQLKDKISEEVKALFKCQT